MAHYDLLEVATDPTHHAVDDPRFAYVIRDREMAQGSTIGAPRCCMVIKPTGAIQKIYVPDVGADFFGAVEVHFWDRRSKIRLGHVQGEFHIHPERQDHVFTLENGIKVHEQLFPYNDRWKGDDADVPPPAVYYRVHLHNASKSRATFDLYAFAELRGNTGHDVAAEYSQALGGIVAWNRGAPSQLRLFTTLSALGGWEVNADPGKAISRLSPGRLSNAVISSAGAPIGVLELNVQLAAGERRWIDFLCVLSIHSRDDLAESRRRCPSGDHASRQTTKYYWSYLERSVLRTPDPEVNHGVLWAKANMLRVQTWAPTGWCFTNDPTRSNNSVARDTAWMSFGADYLNHHFARESLATYFRLAQPSGKIVEYYDVRNGDTDDYGLNVNDDTPLIVIALWHHFAATGNREFLLSCYPKAVAAMEYMLSQRNGDGLIWCTATGSADWGIVGWRNIIPNYRVSGASTEVNSECYAALISLAEMARICGDERAAEKYRAEAQALRDAINTHLVNPENDLYLLAIDVDGSRRTDITADLIFPVLFGVAPAQRAARIIGALSDAAFWTDAGIRTIPRDALEYGPVHGYGLLGGVWVAVSYWFAFAAAKYEPGSMAAALANSFRHFSIDPRRNNTVPGQFAEWLHGEILSNQGMMLSPWDAPRYLWAAIEGAGGLHISGKEARIDPSLADDWRWLTAINVPFRGEAISWIACRLPAGLHLYTTANLKSKTPVTLYARDVTKHARVADPSATVVAFSGEQGALIFVGNSGSRTSMTAASLERLDAEAYSVRVFSTIANQWEAAGRLTREAIADGIAIILGARGFALVELSP
jgi:Bacterial alpha-L-rhamnosidase 6 hairpin glycosidase domain